MLLFTLNIFDEVDRVWGTEKNILSDTFILFFLKTPMDDWN